MSAHVFLDLLNKFGKRDKMRSLHSISSVFSMSLIMFIEYRSPCQRGVVDKPLTLYPCSRV